MKTLCDISALRYHRMPPVIHEVIDERLDQALGPGNWSFEGVAELLGLPHQPVHLLCTNQAARRHTVHQKTQLISAALPFGSRWDFGSYSSVTSPALTLFTLASHLSVVQLAMLMHEFCGNFSVYRPTKQERAYLQELCSQEASGDHGGWKPVLDANGKITDLWQRPAISNINELEKLANDLARAKGRATFTQALRLTREGAASPFEARTGIRLSTPRRLGGEGLSDLTFNERVKLTDQAQLVAGQATAFIDIVLRNPASGDEVGIECQSKLIHDRDEKAIADANRITALQSMGHTIVQLSYRNLEDQAAFESVLSFIFKKLKINRIPKSPSLLRKERQLCYELFENGNAIDW